MRGVADAHAFARSAVMSGARRGAESPLWVKIGALLGLAALNVAIFLAPIDYGFLGTFNYAGAFIITFLANASVVVPVPYLPIVAHMSEAAQLPALVVLLAALGSAVGESISWAVGRAQRDLVNGHAWVARIRQWLSSDWRAAIFLFFFAIPLNPIFDIGGLAAGALGIRFRTFFVAVLLGRVIRFTIVAAVGLRLLSLLQQ